MDMAWHGLDHGDDLMAMAMAMAVIVIMAAMNLTMQEILEYGIERAATAMHLGPCF